MPINGILIAVLFVISAGFLAGYKTTKQTEYFLACLWILGATILIGVVTGIGYLATIVKVLEG